jgi:hypothetical protein
MGLGLTKKLPPKVVEPLLRVRSGIEEIVLQRAPFFRRLGKPPRGYARTNRQISVSRELRFIYFRVAKSANSTVIATLSAAEGRNVPLVPIEGGTMTDVSMAKASYERPGDLTKDDVAQLDEFFKFTVVRNPYTRFVSVFTGIKRPENPETYRRRVRAATGAPEDFTAADFLDYLEAGGIMDDPHWARQADLVFVPITTLDFVGKVENLDRDLDHITSRIFGSAATMRKVAPSAAKSRAAFDSVLQPEVAARIRRLYEYDFDKFAYSADVSKAHSP